MGCNHSNNVHVASKNSKVIKISTDFPKSLITKQPKRNEIKQIPKDEFHEKWSVNVFQSVNQENLEVMAQLAYKLFQNCYILQCTQLCKKIIQTNPSFNNKIEGLGSKQMATSRYDWDVRRWYCQQLSEKKIKFSHYDILSLSFLILSNGTFKYQNQLKNSLPWYEKNVNDNPENIALMMGYANLLTCKLSYDEAIKYYNKIIEKDPYFKNAYITIALIYQYYRINFTKANQVATKINYLFKQNFYGDFILARNIEDIDKKISKLKQIAQKYPLQVRILNEIGICYGSKKNDHEKAIQYYKKCIEIQPYYYSTINNIGVNYACLNNYQQAKKWYYKTLTIENDFTTTYQNLIKAYEALKLSNEEIEAQIKTYKQIDFSVFCWLLGYAYYKSVQMNLIQKAIYWTQKSVQINPNRFDFWNNLGIIYDRLKDYQKAIEKYKKAIQLNPEYELAYFNIGIGYKSLNRVDEAQEYYRKAVEVNPKYTYAWNNLANLYKNKQQYQQAVEYYLYAIEYNSTYTLSLANLGVCYLNLQRYRQAFTIFSRAKASLPNDKSYYSPDNRKFLKNNLDSFDKQGQKWRQSDKITDKQKQSLKQLVQEFESKFKNINGGKREHTKFSMEKIFRPQIVELIKLLNKDKFELKRIKQIFELISRLFNKDEQYFHILPFLIIEKFTTDVFTKNKEVIKVQKQLKKVMVQVSEIVATKQIQSNQTQRDDIPQVKLTKCTVTNSKVNLFLDKLFFSNAEQLYIEINRINDQAKKSYTDFSLLVQETRKKSNGLPGGISTKIPNKNSQQFKVMLRILQKLFKKQINPEKTIQIIKAVDQKLKLIPQPTLDSVVKEIMNVWNDQITSILQQRKQKNIETQFTINDLIRARCFYEKTSQLMKAISVVDEYCQFFGYEIIEVDNRLGKRQTKDVVFKIRIKKAVCELQLALKQDQKLTKLDHCVYEILRSPLGVIFGSYLFLSKQVRYPLTTNCQDILENIEKKYQFNDKQQLRQSTEYVLKSLQTVGKEDEKVIMDENQIQIQGQNEDERQYMGEMLHFQQLQDVMNTNNNSNTNDFMKGLISMFV